MGKMKLFVREHTRQLILCREIFAFSFLHILWSTYQDSGQVIHVR